MRRIIIVLLGLVLILSATGCAASGPAANSVSASKDGFELNLYSDKQVYSSSDNINIYATLKYTGDGDTVTIWHANPYMSFSITEGKGFDTGGVDDRMLSSTVLVKDKLYNFNYQKTGGWDENSPSASYWSSFYSDPNLVLPMGEYTVTVAGNFSLSEDNPSNLIGLSCEMKIKVVK